MTVSYKRLWKLLIDRDLKKKDLAKIANLSQYTLTKMSQNKNVTTDTLCSVCQALSCNIEDIMEIVDETK